MVALQARPPLLGLGSRFAPFRNKGHHHIIYIPDEGTRWYCDLFVQGHTDQTQHDAQFEQRMVELALEDGLDDVLDDHSQWACSITTYTSPGPKEIPTAPVDEVFAGRMATHRIKPGSTWEIGAIFLPTPVLENGRPHYTVLAFVGDRADGTVHGTINALANECRFQLIRRCLEKATADCGHLPAYIVVGSPVAEQALAETAESCGITITPAHDPAEMSLFHEITSSLLESDMFENAHSPFKDIDDDAIQEIQNMFDEARDPDSTPEEILNFMEKLSKNPKANQLIEQFMGEHPELMQETAAIDAPKDYPPPKSRKRYVFSVDLARAKPPIWRRISLPEDASFFDLHLAIQAAFGWSGFHLHAFEIGNRHPNQLIIDWVGEDEDDNHIFFTPEKRQELNTRLKDIFSSTHKSARYTYDFGDSWDHTVKFEKEIDDASSAPVASFEVIKGRGPNPLEDCGGIWALQEFINATHPNCNEIPSERLQEIQNGTFYLDQIFLRNPHGEIQLLDEMNQY